MVTDRIVDIALIKKNPDGSNQMLCRRVNHEMEVPQPSSAVVGITHEECDTKTYVEE